MIPLRDSTSSIATLTARYNVFRRILSTCIYPSATALTCQPTGTPGAKSYRQSRLQQISSIPRIMINRFKKDLLDRQETADIIRTNESQVSSEMEKSIKKLLARSLHGFIIIPFIKKQFFPSFSIYIRMMQLIINRNY